MILDHTQEEWYAIFNAIGPHPDSLSFLEKLLVNEHVNLQKLYNYSCYNWTLGKLDAMIAWSLKLNNKLISNLLLDSECISRTPFSNLARKKILEAGIASVVPRDLSKLQDHEWLPVLRTGDPSYFYLWCQHVPARLFNEQFFQEIDIPLILTLPCLYPAHPNNAHIVDELVKQIQSAADASIARLVAVLDNVSPALDSHMRIMAALHQKYCLGKAASPIGQLLRIRLKCQNSNPSLFHKQMVFALQDPLLSANSVAILLDMWMAMVPENLIIQALRLNPPRVSIRSASSREVIYPVVKKAFALPSESDGRTIIELVGLDYDLHVILFPEVFWIDLAGDLNLSRASRKKYYCARKLELFSNKELTFLNLANVRQDQRRSVMFTRLQARVKAIISNDRNFDVIHSIAFPTTSLIIPHLRAPLDVLLDLLLYSLFHFGQVPAKFSRHFCHALKGHSEHSDRYLGTQFQRLRFKRHKMLPFPENRLTRYSEFAAAGRVLLIRTAEKMDRQMKLWELYPFFRGVTLCELLSE